MKKVLLVEDDKFLIKVYKMKMQKRGIETTCLHTGEGVVETARSEKPGVIILDLVMPAKDGFEALRELKDDPETRGIPVLVLTALESPEDIKRVTEMGADKYITKTSVSLSQIVEMVIGYVS